MKLEICLCILLASAAVHAETTQEPVEIKEGDIVADAKKDATSWTFDDISDEYKALINEDSVNPDFISGNPDQKKRKYRIQERIPVDDNNKPIGKPERRIIEVEELNNEEEKKAVDIKNPIPEDNSEEPMPGTDVTEKPSPVRLSLSRLKALKNSLREYLQNMEKTPQSNTAEENEQVVHADPVESMPSEEDEKSVNDETNHSELESDHEPNHSELESDHEEEENSELESDHEPNNSELESDHEEEDEDEEESHEKSNANESGISPNGDNFGILVETNRAKRTTEPTENTKSTPIPGQKFTEEDILKYLLREDSKVMLKSDCVCAMKGLKPGERVVEIRDVLDEDPKDTNGSAALNYSFMTVAIALFASLILQ
jgi:hypothetical protein